MSHIPHYRTSYLPHNSASTLLIAIARELLTSPNSSYGFVFRSLVGACHTLRLQGIVHIGKYHLHHFATLSQDVLLTQKPDIKPQNMFIVPDPSDPDNPFNHPVLSDLISYYRLGAEEIRDVFGTDPRFRAPEQNGPYLQSPAKTEIYQIGATMFAVMRNTTGFVTTEYITVERASRSVPAR
jgi:hypothetical protein